VTNWLADPEACVIRLKNESGCIILAGRNEILSRSTVVHRQETPEGVRYEWGHMAVEVKGKAGEQRMMRPTTSDQVGKVTTTTGTDWLLPEHANVMSDLLRAAYVNAPGTCGGKTMLELFWEELMTVYERLMTGQEAEDDVGIAQGVAYCIAVACNPYRPDIDAVRAQAAERWEAMEQEEAQPPKPTRTESARAARRRLRAGR